MMAMSSDGMEFGCLSNPKRKRKFVTLTDEQKERLKRERLKDKGLKEFWIEGECIMAINERVAIKKYNNKNKTQWTRQ